MQMIKLVKILLCEKMSKRIMNPWIWSRLWNLRRNLAAGNTLRMEGRREGRQEVSKTSPASELLRALCLFVAELMQLRSCFLCAHWINVDMKEHSNFPMKIYPWTDQFHHQESELICAMFLVWKGNAMNFHQCFSRVSGMSMAHPHHCSPHLSSPEKWERPAGITKALL